VVQVLNMPIAMEALPYFRWLVAGFPTLLPEFDPRSGHV
jgi:hypothetical protein